MTVIVRGGFSQAWPLFLCALALCPSPALAAPAACANGDPVMGPAEIKAVQGLRVDSGWVRWPGPKATTYQGHLHLFKAKTDLDTLVVLRQVGDVAGDAARVLPALARRQPAQRQ